MPARKLLALASRRSTCGCATSERPTSDSAAGALDSATLQWQKAQDRSIFSRRPTWRGSMRPIAATEGGARSTGGIS
jgi:hypothetical protein